jgi:ligand-binding SRPBCC domain-containing protein
MQVERSQWVPRPIDTVFRFFSDLNNLPMISPPESGARIQSIKILYPKLAGIPRSERMAGAGTELTISFRLLPFLPLRGVWTARIVEFEYGRLFRDVQVRGPFKRFEHAHLFEPQSREGQPGTLIRDLVEYDIGYGAVGAIMNATVVPYHPQPHVPLSSPGYRETLVERAINIQRLKHRGNWRMQGRRVKLREYGGTFPLQCLRSDRREMRV